MIFPLEKLIKYTDNIYEITVACSHRAYQISRIGDPEVEESNDKVVSVAARQLFDKHVTFRIEQE